MGHQSQSGQMILRTQAVEGTYQADTATAGVAMRIRSGTLTSNRDLLIPDPEIGGGRDVSDAYLGPVSWSGDVEFYGRMNSFATLMAAAFGEVDSAARANPNEEAHNHTITPVDNTALPWLSIEEAIAGSFAVFRYTDVKVNTLHLECDATGFLMGTAGLIAKKQTSGHTRSDATDPAGDGSDPSLWDNTPMVVGTNVLVTYNGVQLPAKSFSLDINNNLEDDDFRLGSFYLGDVTEKRREVTMGVTVRPADAALWKQSTYGAPLATQVGGLTTKEQTVITVQTYESIAGTTVPYQMSFTAPETIIAPFGVEPSGDDVIEHDLEVRAIRPDISNPIATAVVTNDLAAVA